MCHDVEEVFWGHKVSDSQKVQEAFSFRKKKRITEISSKNLSSKEKRTCTSNILDILDKYLSTLHHLHFSIKFRSSHSY